MVCWLGVGATTREARSAGVPGVDPADVVVLETGVEEVEEVEGGVADCCCWGDEVVIVWLKVIDGA